MRSGKELSETANSEKRGDEARFDELIECPITLQPIIDPVKEANCNKLFENYALTRCTMENNNTCPWCRAPIKKEPVNQLEIVNYALYENNFNLYIERLNITTADSLSILYGLLANDNQTNDLEAQATKLSALSRFLIEPLIKPSFNYAFKESDDPKSLVNHHFYINLIRDQEMGFSGCSAVTVLASLESGINLLRVSPEMVERINSQGFNAIATEGLIKNTSVALFLCAHEMGRELLIENHHLRSLLTSKNIFLKSSNPNPKFKGKCAADYLIQVKSKNLFDLLDVDLRQQLLNYRHYTHPSLQNRWFNFVFNPLSNDQDYPPPRYHCHMI